jgi:signal transduction histidine kinase
MRMLGRTIAIDKEEVLRLDEIINETINLMKDTSEKENIKISFIPPEKMLVARSQPAALQQILLNLLLNGTQQIAEFRSKRGGMIHIFIEDTGVSSPNKSICISIRDNGPGIHATLWETIFDLGYSTRKDGSGIGLYISKRLAEDKLKGQLYVQESFILSGTTVTLEIPHQF